MHSFVATYLRAQHSQQLADACVSVRVLQQSLDVVLFVFVPHSTAWVLAETRPLPGLFLALTHPFVGPHLRA